MVYYTGDIHSSAFNVVRFSKQYILSAYAIIVILGDVEANFYLNERDTTMKSVLGKFNPTILCINGNHEIRPANTHFYLSKDWNGGTA